ncbi:MAG: acyl-CoA dehydratase activase [Chloroflexi bacterium]|nr:acyl-CoA dehydratase activase [Chloroflexota bacterium]
MAYLGMDIGSVSVKTALIDDNENLLDTSYRRHHGRPVHVAYEALKEILGGPVPVDGIAFTGSGGTLAADLMGAPSVNEIVAQVSAVSLLNPYCRSIIEIGGEDSRLILVREGDNGLELSDFAMNSICAAGTGSFLDQQATRLGVSIENEFGELALKSKKPPRIAGRCSVFAKTDMIHLQQQATPVEDIVGGLCFAFARNFVAVLARGKEIAPPVAFHGGVAANQGMVRAFKETIGFDDYDFLVPEYHAVAGAVGAAVLAKKSRFKADPAKLEEYLEKPGVISGQEPLENPGDEPDGSVKCPAASSEKIPAYLGVDIGSISTNVVVMAEDGGVIAKSYLMTAGRPLEAVKKGMAEVSHVAGYVEIKGVCTTGSGRYLVGDFIGADIVKNEITAQARAAVEIDGKVDTIFEIGGQDSKYISLDNGAVVDFEMNKVCAAGTGSFLEEQAERLGISIKEEFAQRAFESPSPVRLGERCTVFMETDLIAHQQQGAKVPDLAGGLAYSIVHNYLNRVVADHRVGDHIFFQGGVAFNRSVVSAFTGVTGKPVIVPPHHEVTGAIGCALMARDHKSDWDKSSFKGWDFDKRKYELDSFECKGCPNICEINRVNIEGESPLYYGGRCEKYEVKKGDKKGGGMRDLFAERDKLLFEGYDENEPVPGDAPVFGITRSLHFYEYMPFWLTFLKEAGIRPVISSPTNTGIINRGVEATLSESCLHVKVAHGHLLDLLDRGIKKIFLPSVTQLPRPHKGYKESVTCPYVQSIPYALRAAVPPGEYGYEMISPIIDLSGEGESETLKELHSVLKPYGIKRTTIRKAYEKAWKAQNDFTKKLQEKGREVLANLGPDEKALVIVSRPYNGCDSGLNLEIPRKLRNLGTLAIPIDMLPVDDIDLSNEMPDLTWRYGQKILAGAEIIRKDPRLYPVYITNFGCGPDSFLLKFFRARMGGKVFLQLEIDEHSSDVGAITRCEAFLDSLEKREKEKGNDSIYKAVPFKPGKGRILYIPYMCDGAHVIAAAFRAEGVDARIMPPTDDAALALGKKYTTGKECFPCIVTTGDMVKVAGSPGFDPENSSFFMPSAGGGCRFGYYNILQRMVLDEIGLPEVPIFSPNQNEDFYESLGMTGDTFVRLAWQGIIAAELIEKALNHTRPYEINKGDADLLYSKSLGKIVDAIERRKDLLPLLKGIREEFESVPTRDKDGTPRIGVVGEIFVRSHIFSNNNLIKTLEELGAEVWTAPFSEWIYYVNLLQKIDTRRKGKLGSYLRVLAEDKVMKHDEHRFARAFRGFLDNLDEISSDKCIGLADAYLHPSFRGEAILSIGKAVDFFNRGLAGVVNVMPFTCMPGTVTSGLLKKFQREHDGMPVVTMAYDGQSEGNSRLRLEAFVHQCKSYAGRK